MSFLRAPSLTAIELAICSATPRILTMLDDLQGSAFRFVDSSSLCRYCGTIQEQLTAHLAEHACEVVNNRQQLEHTSVRVQEAKHAALQLLDACANRIFFGRYTSKSNTQR